MKTGQFAKAEYEGGSYWFRPARKGTKADFNDIRKELFCMDMWGGLYACLLRIPDEFPMDEDSVEVMYPEDACKILAQWCGYELRDSGGNVLVGNGERE